jgi:hypothetical protein
MPATSRASRRTRACDPLLQSVTTSANLTLDTADLEATVQKMYREVAEHPDKTFHFETGRDLAVRLGYPAAELARIPAEAVASFAGVG